MGSPRKPGFGGLPCDYELARGVYRVSGKIKTDTVEAVVGRHGGIWLPRTEMIECQLRLWKEVMPQVFGEVDVDGREDGDEVVFACAYSTLSGVGTVVKGGNKLNREVDAGKVLSEFEGGFVVGDKGGKVVVFGFEEGEGAFEGGKIASVGAVGLGFIVYVPSIGGHEYVLVPCSRGDRQTTRQVAGHPAVSVPRCGIITTGYVGIGGIHSGGDKIGGVGNGDRHECLGP